MRTVSSSELRTRLGRYLKFVRRGETIAITNREKTVAWLKPPAPEEVKAGVPKVKPASRD
jgi:antitoxin (DNA-binding transcriptional repressor) of toxin-antitoxin stability system